MQDDSGRKDALWALVGRLERGEEQRVLAEATEAVDDGFPNIRLMEDLEAAKQLKAVYAVIEALDEAGDLAKLDAHGDCSCNDDHCPGFDPPRSPTEDELQEMAYEALLTLEGQASEEHDWWHQQRPGGAR